MAKTRPRPFDAILIDDTSRFGRYLPDVLRQADILDSYGVFIYFVVQRIDSRDPSSRTLVTIYGMMDEQYVTGLRDKIHRGQHGRILNGYIPAGKCYGYKNVPIEDPNRRGEYGRPAVIGVKQEAIPEEAAVVERIFEMKAGGASYSRIAKALNADRILSPQPSKTNRVHAWCPSGIREMFFNEKYRGVVVWNRTETVRNRETGRTEQRPRPESEWVRVPVPHLRIVSDELWERVQEQNRRNKEIYGGQRFGGMNRTQSSCTYLFSGLLSCGLCGSNMVIASGAFPYARYGCPNHRRRGVCENKLTVPQRPLEQQLIGAITKQLLDPRLEKERTQEFLKQLNAILEQEAKLARDAASKSSELKEQRAATMKEADNLIAAIRQHGLSPLLSAELSKVETRLAEIDRTMDRKPAGQTPTFSLQQINQFLKRKSRVFVDVLTGDPTRAKQELQKHITKLVLTPK